MANQWDYLMKLRQPKWPLSAKVMLEYTFNCTKNGSLLEPSTMTNFGQLWMLDTTTGTGRSALLLNSRI
jgi:hypothetical protein